MLSQKQIIQSKLTNRIQELEHVSERLASLKLELDGALKANNMKWIEHYTKEYEKATEEYKRLEAAKYALLSQLQEIHAA